MDKARLMDMVILAGVIIIFFTIIFLMAYYFNQKNNQCIQNPFIYGAKLLENKYEYPVVGSVQVITPYNIKSPIFTFNSINFTSG